MIAYCGFNCEECPVYMVTVGGDRAMREKLALEYSSQTCSFTENDMFCEGCLSDMADDSKMCGFCEIRKCARRKSVKTCGKCPGYPCDIVEKYITSGSDSRKLLDEMANSN